MGATYLADLLESILAAALAALDPARTGIPAPALSGITHGLPVIDACEMNGRLAAYLDPALAIEPRYLQSRVGGDLPSGRCAVTSFAHISVELWRCVPTPDDFGNPPLVTDEAAAAYALATSAWCLYTGLLQAALAGSLMPGGQCDTVVLAPLEVLEPQGGAGGIKLPLTIQLSDGGPPP